MIRMKRHFSNLAALTGASLIEIQVFWDVERSIQKIFEGLQSALFFM